MGVSVSPLELDLEHGRQSSSSAAVDVFFVSCDCNLDASPLFERHSVAILVSQRIFNTKISIPVFGPINPNLCVFRLRTQRVG